MHTTHTAVGPLNQAAKQDLGGHHSLLHASGQRDEGISDPQIHRSAGGPVHSQREVSDGDVASSPSPIRVALVDGQRMFRDALRHLLREHGFDVTIESGTGKGALDLLAKVHADVVVVGAALSDMSATDFARQHRALGMTTRILALLNSADPRTVQTVLKAGSEGCVTTTAGADELLRGIRALAAGHAFLSPEVARAALASSDSSAPSPTAARLGPREHSVLKLITEGEPSRVIATKLGISVSTVEAHRRNIMRKLGLHSIAALTRYAIREGLTTA